MSAMLRLMRDEWSSLLRAKEFGPLLGGLGLLSAALVANYLAGIYASARISNPVTDLLLDHLPIVNPELLGWIFIQGALLFWLFVLGLILTRPTRAPYLLSAIALFVFIRSISVCLTHLAPYASNVAPYTAGSILGKLTFTGDLFFSGHTGLPFLLALIFWPHRSLGWFFLITSVLFAATVLLGRLHYSVDVFGAYFITYTIFALSRWLFATNYRQFLGTI